MPGYQSNALLPLIQHGRQNPACFHVPGHGQGKDCLRNWPDYRTSLALLDLTELPGLDDLHNPTGPIAAAQNLAAKMYGAEKSFFLVNGTTVGIQALITSLGQQKKIIVSRNVHRSVLGGLVIAGADPIYVLPDTIPHFEIDCGLTPGTIQQALVDSPDAAAVLVVRPSYYGIAADLEGLPG